MYPLPLINVMKLKTKGHPQPEYHCHYTKWCFSIAEMFVVVKNNEVLSENVLASSLFVPFIYSKNFLRATKHIIVFIVIENVVC